MVETNRRYLAPAEQLGGQNSTVAGDDMCICIDQDRDVKAKNFDTVCYLADLLSRMSPRIFGVGLERLYREPLHLQGPVNIGPKRSF
jgi:hypothetical protein